MKYEITVQLKPEVLDAEGRSIASTLQRSGCEWLSDVKVAKTYIIETKGEVAALLLDKLCKDYLSNPVSQKYQWRLLPEEIRQK